MSRGGDICPVKGQASRARNLRSVGELLSPAAAAAAAAAATAAAAPYNHYGQQHDERASARAGRVIGADP